jgi:serine/threonine-protein kinase/endoribonuclease IRE1
MNVLVLSHLLVFILSLALFTASTAAAPDPSPDPYPAVISLPARVPRARQPRFSTTSKDSPAAPIAATISEVEVEHDLLPFVIVSTIDGALHAIDRDTGKVRWTLRDGVEPLVGGGVRGRGEGGEDYIVEPQGGGLFVFEETEDGEEGEAKVRKLPLSVDQL